MSACSSGQKLRDVLESPDVSYACEAHSPLSARIGSEAGFLTLWASGLCMSAALGVRDCNELSQTQVVDYVAQMVDVTPGVPILVDGDNGGGHFNSARRFGRELDRRGAAGVAFEDKVFPKQNSFRAVHHELVDPTEFATWITATREFVDNPDFVIVARTEALIAGHSIAEALDRAHRYVNAGADAIFIHSKHSVPDQILGFAQQWDGSAPLVVAPTTFPFVTEETWNEAGISLVIWANQLLRASIVAMQSAAERLVHSGQAGLPSEATASIAEVFRLQQIDEFAEAEARFLVPSESVAGADLPL